MKEVCLLYSGENIFVYAQVFNNEALSQVKTSNIESGSSLFASISTDRSAEIGSFRHLENLDERVSGWDRISCTLGR